MRRAAAIAIGLAALAASGCGERTFTATGFVDEVNKGGAMLTLGGPLQTNQPDRKIYGVTLRRAPGEIPAGMGEGAPSGSLTVYGDSGAAGTGYQDCKRATGLLCFQAGNVVLVFEGDRPGPAQLRLGTAMKRLSG